MNLPAEPDRWTVDIANAQREDALAAFGYTERQARFLAHVLVHSGVFVERQYCSFAGIAHGQKSTDFIKLLVERRCATPINGPTPSRAHVPRSLQASVGRDRRAGQPVPKADSTGPND